MSHRRVIVSLTGGLGNQLFQFAQGLAIKPDQLRILSSLGKPRTTNGKPDLLHFTLPTNCVPIEKGSAPKVIQKIAGYVLRKGIYRRRFEDYFVVNALIDLVSYLILILYMKQRFILTVGEGVGYSKLKRGKKQLLIGYFQHGNHLSDVEVVGKLRSLVPSEMTKKLMDLIEKAKRESPIFVHYRLTDYLKEDSFGIPSASYYTKALKKLNGANRSIWVFSDDIEMARGMFPEEFASRAYFVSQEDLTPAQSLQLFRYGSDYVIANSSFSWWGAALRIDTAGVVFAPYPWFKNLPEPVDLIPKGWERLAINE